MKVQRIFMLMVMFFVLSTAAVVASSIWGEYKGFNIARLVVNNETKEFPDSEVPPLIVDGKTVLPLRAMSDALQALLKWDDASKTAYLFKPNVHMFFTSEVRKDSSIIPFSVVARGDEVNFTVFTQVDNLKTSINSVRVSVVSPSGRNVITPIEKSIADSKESFWLKVPLYGVSFSESGTYVVKFAMQQSGSSDYTVVSEKQIQAE
ncbi:stalk domain-containing protein [Paenibacillus qinlingensis]|uniref:Copper amine oxidase-like N-terminal domain-containing protein n=1 Tax=Paenibacillus qinlingensis TaxID=1837343 RepID=A0ABU1NVT9_9BACL|nr:stalk domain-containing protein [Paenibacillus qinlingensis]MDR6551449.1 hypothetical protein [Paenibacillus qinlingensis]